VQERFTDALMTRTCHRPMACGLLSSRAGTLIGLVTGSTGLLTLYLGSSSASAFLGLVATAWYLLLYTPLKRVTSFAVVAGTPCGILPPLIGWHAAGGDLLSPQVLSLGLIMLLWQVPHFWLLALPDRDELDLAGFKVLPKALSNQKLLQVCHFWIMGLVSTTLLLPLLQLLWQPVLQGLTVGLALSFAIWASTLQRKVLFFEHAARRLKFGLHLYLALVVGLLLLQNLLARFGA
jgi:protoheme IX farnesyltransferase